MTNQEPIDPTLPARLRAFHEGLPLAGEPRNAVLALPDDQVLYLAAILRDTPVPAPTMTPEAWQGFLDVLRPHGVYPLMAYRLRAWPEDCRPPLEVMAYLNRVFLYAAARSMRAGRQIQAVVDALEAAGIESVLLKGPALRQSVDIDILARPGDALAAEGVFQEQLILHRGSPAKTASVRAWFRLSERKMRPPMHRPSRMISPPRTPSTDLTHAFATCTLGTTPHARTTHP